MEYSICIIDLGGMDAPAVDRAACLRRFQKWLCLVKGDTKYCQKRTCNISRFMFGVLANLSCTS